MVMGDPDKLAPPGIIKTFESKRQEMNKQKAEELETLFCRHKDDLEEESKVNILESIAHLRAGGDM